MLTPSTSGTLLIFAAVSSTSRHLRGIAQRVILPALVLTYAVNTSVCSARWGARRSNRRRTMSNDYAPRLEIVDRRAESQRRRASNADRNPRLKLGRRSDQVRSSFPQRYRCAGARGWSPPFYRSPPLTARGAVAG